MGAVELKFSGSFERSSYLKEFCCPYCDKFITDQDLAENITILINFSFSD